MVYESPDDIEGYTEITLFTRKFDNSRFGKFELAKDVNIIQHERRAQKIFNIFELVAHEKFDCRGDDIERKAEEIMAEWGQQKVTLDDLLTFCEIFNFGLEIWQREDQLKDRQVCRSLQFTIPGTLLIKIETADVVDTFTKSVQLGLIQERFETHTCPTRNCRFSNTQRWRYLRHVEKCTGETTVTHKQKVYGGDHDENVKILRDLGFLPIHFERRFGVYDIEAIPKTLNSQITEKTRIISTYELLSIGVIFSDGSEHFLVRNSSSHYDLQVLIQQFWEVLRKFQDKIQAELPQSVKNGLKYIDDKLLKKNMRSLTPRERANIFRQKKILNDYKNLVIYSWVGLKYF